MPLVLNDTLTPVVIETFCGKAIDVPGASVDDAVRLHQWGPNGGRNQRWYLDPCGGGGQCRIINQASGRVLDITDGGPEGTQVQQYAWAANDNQRWLVEEVAGGVLIASFAHQDLVLDVGGASPDDGAPIVIWPRNGGPNQVFVLK